MQSLDLRLDALDMALGLPLPVDLRGTVRVGPSGVLPGRGARRISDRLLTEKQQWVLGEAAAGRCERVEDVLLAAADVDGARLAGGLRRPWHGAG